MRPRVPRYLSGSQGFAIISEPHEHREHPLAPPREPVEVLRRAGHKFPQAILDSLAAEGYRLVQTPEQLDTCPTCDDTGMVAATPGQPGDGYEPCPDCSICPTCGSDDPSDRRDPCWDRARLAGADESDSFHDRPAEPEHPDTADPIDGAAAEARLREVLATQGRNLGEWDEWTKSALGGYNGLTVTARAALAHLHGRHDDTDDPYQFCVLCETFRVPASRPVVDDDTRRVVEALIDRVGERRAAHDAARHYGIVLDLNHFDIARMERLAELAAAASLPHGPKGPTVTEPRPDTDRSER